MAKKYIDADILRKEIEKERESIDGLFIEGDNNFYDGQDDAYNHTLALIDSLRQEQQEVDLEEELDKFYGMYRKDGKTYDITDDEEVSDWKEDGNSWFKIEFARHFYELGKNSK